jgi:hypothetical protein
MQYLRQGSGPLYCGIRTELHVFLIFSFSFPSGQLMVKFPYGELSANLSHDIRQNLLRINAKID